MDLKLRSLTLFSLLFFVYFLIPALCQIDPNDQLAVTNTFYLTSKTDCSNELKNIFNHEAIVRGYDLKNIGTGPKTCTIRITSKSIYPGVQLQIRIISMDILDCTTHLSIYDGQETQKLSSFDCHSNQNVNRFHLVTSGDTVSFMMSRNNPENQDFDIEIRVKPIRGGISPDKDRFNYFSFQKFDQDAIVGMIGGFYALIIIICIGVVGYCNFRYRGMNKKWETHQLATMKTDTTFDARSQVSQPPWSVASQSREPVSQYSRSYNTEPFSRRGATARSDDGSSVVYDHDEKFQQRNLMRDERDRHRGRDRMASQNTTYTDDDDQEDPDNFKEKVITPRVKTSGARWKPQDRRTRDRRPPSFEEATRDSSMEGSSDEETEESSDNDSTRKRLTTSSGSDDYSETETESETDNSSGSSRRGARARPKKRDKQSKSKARRRRQSSTDDASSQRTEPRVSRQHPHPIQPPMHGAMSYPRGPFVPVMAGPPPQFQMVPPHYPPPQYPVDPPPPVSQGNVQPTEPPVYSYLVRRGYTPLDPNNRHKSPAGSVASSQKGPPAFREEPDTPLQSGVEYMRR